MTKHLTNIETVLESREAMIGDYSIVYRDPSSIGDDGTAVGIALADKLEARLTYMKNMMIIAPVFLAKTGAESTATPPFYTGKIKWVVPIMAKPDSKRMVRHGKYILGNFSQNVSSAPAYYR